VSAIVLVDEEHATGFWTNAGYAHQREAGRFTRVIDGA
jgi:hypothetical protein